MEESTKIERSQRTLGATLNAHLPALLFGWFWLGLIVTGLLAPPDRVAELGDGLFTQGWHLSALGALLGGVTLGAYMVRLRR